MNDKVALLILAATLFACKSTPSCPAATKQLGERAPNGSEFAAGATSADVFTLARVL
jgi:hypothetical protein